MACLTIENHHGFQTVFSNDPDSPAAPFVREYHPKSLEELQQLGIIPPFVHLKDIKEAREAALRDRINVNVSIVPSVLARAESYPDASRLAKALNVGIAQQAAAAAMSNILYSHYNYHRAEADLLASKALSVGFPGVALIPVWRQIELAADLIVQSPVVIASNINALLVRDVVIHRTGELLVQGSYFLLRCRSIAGDTPWWGRLNQISQNWR